MISFPYKVSYIIQFNFIKKIVEKLYNSYVISNRNSNIPKDKFLIQFFDFKNNTNKKEDSIMVENKTASDKPTKP